MTSLNTVLEEFLWYNFRVFVLTLPARAPEWNPIEQVWNVYDQKMQTYRASVMKIGICMLLKKFLIALLTQT
jgi:hypothetical protein